MNGRYDRLAATGKDLTRWDRFMITYADGGTLRLFDPRRLGRVRLDPNLDDLGPDAGLVSAAEFAERVGGGRAPIKARLLDQSVIAGVGNLLADEILWQARISPRRPSGDLSRDRVDDLARGRAGCGAVGDRQGRIAHRDHDRLPQGRAPLPALRRRADPGHRRRPHDLVVPARAAVKSSSYEPATISTPVRSPSPSSLPMIFGLPGRGLPGRMIMVPALQLRLDRVGMLAPVAPGPPRSRRSRRC